MDWISVKDRLPSADGKVLVVYKFRQAGAAGMRFVSVLDYYFFDPQPHFQHESAGIMVTHWMPLPELPKEAE